MKHLSVVRKLLNINLYILTIPVFLFFIPIGIYATSYCIPSYKVPKSQNIPIKLVKIDTFNGSITKKDYLDTTYVLTPAIELYSGNTFPIYASDSSGAFTMNGRFAFWVDYNNDGDFDDKNEFIDSSKKESYYFKSKWTIPIQIPAGYYRVRFRFITPGLYPIKPYIGDSNAACKTQLIGSAVDLIVSIRHSYHTDAGFISLLSPSKPYCGDSFTKFTFVYRNWGLDTIKSLPVSLTIQPKKGASVLVKDTIKSFLPHNKIDTFTLSYNFNSYGGGTYYFYLHTGLINDSARDNDSFFIKMNLYPGINPPKIMNDKRCDEGIQKMYAINDTNKYYKTYWYAASNPGKPLAVVQDTAYIEVKRNEKYFVSFWNAEHYNMEPYDTTFGGAKRVGRIYNSGNLTQAIYNYDDLYIDTVSVYLTASSNVHFVILDSLRKNIIKEDSFDIIVKNPLERIDLPLWMYIPKGKARCFSAAKSQFKSKSDGFYCDVGVMNDFVSKLLILYCNSIGGEYMYFYNWRISSVGCKSKPVEVFPFYATNALWQADTTGITPREFKFTPKDSTHATYLWHFGDGDSSTNATPTHQYKKDSSYKVSLKITNKYGCDSTYDSIIQVHYTGIIQVREKNNIVIRPNPTTNTIHISCISTNSITEIRDMQGRYIMQMATGKEETDISSLPKGMYIVTVKNAEGIWVGKFVKE